MAKKPELQATARNREELERVLKAGADAVVIGDDRFASCLPGSWDISAIRWAVQTAHGQQARLYVAVNGLFGNSDAELLPDYLREVAATEADAVLFNDPAVVAAMRELGLSLPLHWDGEMLATNFETANYWGRRGATRVLLSRELNMEEALEFKRSCHLEVQVQVHGITRIYQSKRPLLSHYREHQGKALPGEALGRDEGLYLVEYERENERFPVYEDASGTHIMSSEDLCMLEDLNELMDGGFDSFKVEGLLKSMAYNEAVVGFYRQAIDAYAADPADWFKQEWLDTIKALQADGRPLSFGFYYKEQVY